MKTPAPYTSIFKVLKAHQLTLTDIAVLERLHRNNNTTFTKIGSALLVSRTTVKSSITRLHRLNFVAHIRWSERLSSTSLTPEGRKLLTHLNTFLNLSVLN